MADTQRAGAGGLILSAVENFLIGWPWQTHGIKPAELWASPAKVSRIISQNRPFFPYIANMDQTPEDVLKGRYPFATRHKYPHMLGEDIPVWDRFVRLNPDRFDSVDYDWRVGEGTPAPPEWEENLRRMAIMISQKRIDVVGWKDGAATIVEVKDRATASTAGQIEGYRILWNIEEPEHRNPKVLVVCSRVTHDDHIVLLAREIPVEIV